MSEVRLSKYDWTEFVREKWKYFWMNQKQNDQRDYENYHRRAFGVDANMLHHLGELIEKEHNRLLDAANAEIERLQMAITHSASYAQTMKEKAELYQSNWVEAKHEFGKSLQASRAKLATANALLDKALKSIRRHHDWHLSYGVVPESFVGMDMGAEYADSEMCDETIEVIKEIEQARGEG